MFFRCPCRRMSRACDHHQHFLLLFFSSSGEAGSVQLPSSLCDLRSLWGNVFPFLVETLRAHFISYFIPPPARDRRGFFWTPHRENLVWFLEENMRGPQNWGPQKFLTVTGVHIQPSAFLYRFMGPASSTYAGIRCDSVLACLSGVFDWSKESH